MASAVAPRKIKIDITSDPICPFCFIGKRKLERAIEMVKEKDLNLEYDIQFHPFLLDPTLKPGLSINKRERYVKKFGAERAPMMQKMMVERGKENGINFSFGGNISQTTEAHRLLALAYEKGQQSMQLGLVEKLFTGYFEREQDIGDYDFLSEQAVSVGLFQTVEEAKEWLKTDEKKAEVARGIREAQAMGITGVPFFLFNNRYAISGAEDSELFVEVFERLAGQTDIPNARLPDDSVCKCD